MAGPFYDHKGNGYEIENEDATSTDCSLSGIYVCYGSTAEYYMQYVSFNMTGTSCTDLTWGDNAKCDE